MSTFTTAAPEDREVQRTMEADGVTETHLRRRGDGVRRHVRRLAGATAATALTLGLGIGAVSSTADAAMQSPYGGVGTTTVTCGPSSISSYSSMTADSDIWISTDQPVAVTRIIERWNGAAWVSYRTDVFWPGSGSIGMMDTIAVPHGFYRVSAWYWWYDTNGTLRAYGSERITEYRQQGFAGWWQGITTTSYGWCQA